MTLSSRSSFGEATGRRTRAGVTLVEILIVLFVMGVGLLALIEQFAIGALQLAGEVQDNRTAAVAADALSFYTEAENLVSQTRKFAATSLVNGAVDSGAAGKLEEEYGALAAKATSIEHELLLLKVQLPQPRAQAYLNRLLGQMYFIELRISFTRSLLSRLAGTGPPIGID